MIHKILRWYRDNKVKFWKNVLLIIGIVFLVYFLNNYLSQKTKEEGTINKNIYYNASTIKSQQSLISSENVEQENLKVANEIIDKFINYCNNLDYNNAYYLLSEECKEQNYPNIEIFKQNYVDRNFSTYKTYKMQNWNNNTYKIEYRESPLDTGGEENQEFIRDYITITSDNKLNISGFISKAKEGSKLTHNNIIFNVLNKKTYMEYVIYNIEITNNSKQKCILDSLDSANSIYLLDEKGIKYYAYINEINKEEMIIPQGATMEVNIKFISSYSSTKNIKSIVFSNVAINNNHEKVVIDL